MSKITSTDELEAQSKKPNIIYSESLENVLPDDFINIEKQDKQIVLSIGNQDYDLSLVSIKKKKAGNFCSFKAYNLDIKSFIFNEKCEINIYSKVYESKLVEVKMIDGSKEQLYIVTIFIERQ